MQKPRFQKNRLSLGNWLKLLLGYSFFLVVHTNLSFAQTEDAPPQGIRWKLISEKQLPLRIDTIRNLSSLYLKDPKTYLPATSLFSWPSMDSLLPQKLSNGEPVNVIGRAVDYTEQIFEVVRSDSTTYTYPTGKYINWLRIAHSDRNLWVREMDIAVQTLEADSSRFFLVPEISGGKFNLSTNWRLEKYDLPSQSKLWEFSLPRVGYDIEILPAYGLRNVENIVSIHYYSRQCGGGGTEIIVLDLGSKPYPLQYGGYDGEGFLPRSFSNWHLPALHQANSDSLSSCPSLYFDTEKIAIPNSLRRTKNHILAFEEVRDTLLLDSSENLPFTNPSGMWLWKSQTTTTYGKWNGHRLRTVLVDIRTEFLPQEPDLMRFIEFYQD